MHVKPLGFRFSDLKGIGKYKNDFGPVERVAEAYLQATRADEHVFRASRNPNDYRRGTAIFENKSIIDDHVKAWKDYYGKKSTADFWIKNMQAEMEGEVDFAVDMITRAEQLSERNGAAELRQNIARRVGNEFFSVVSGVWREVYDALNVKENPELLYALAFNAEADKRGYSQKTGDELASILNQQKISVSEFEHYTNRDLAAEQAEKTRAAQPAPAPAAQTVQAQRPQPRPARPAQTGGINANDIGAAVDAAELGETVRGTIIEPTGVQPVVFDNLMLYRPDGQPFRAYRRVVLDGVIQQGSKTQEGWIEHYNGTPCQLPSVPLLYAMIEDLVRSGNSAKEALLADLGAYWIATSTQQDYAQNKFTHDVGRQPFELPCQFPEKSEWTRNLNEDGQQTLKALLMPHDLESALQTLQTFASVPAYLWVPNQEGRREQPLGAAFASVYRGSFSLSCNYHPDDDGRSRGVAI